MSLHSDKKLRIDENQLKEMKRLANILEKSNNDSNSRLVAESLKANDGKHYGIFEEGAYLFIKESYDGKEGTYDYIGGVANKTKGNRYTSFTSAQKNLNLKVKEINESTVAISGMGFKEAEEVDGEDVEAVSAEAPVAEPTVEPTAEAPATDSPETATEPDFSDLGNDATADTEEPVAEPEMDTEMPVDGGESADDPIEEPVAEPESTDGEAEETSKEFAGNIQSMIMEMPNDEYAIESVAQILAAIVNKFEGDEKASEIAQKLHKYAGELEVTKEGNMMGSEKDKFKLDDLSESAIKKLVKKHNLMEKASVKNKMEKLKVLHEAIATKKREITLIKENKKLKKQLNSKTLKKKKMNENNGKVNDPSKGEMVSFLKDYFGNESEMFDIEAAIYWFAKDYHSGQNSNLYSASSTSKYKPSRMLNSVKDEDEMVIEMYDELVDKFGDKSDTMV